MAISQSSNLHFCNKHTLSERTGYSPHTLKKLRQRGDWIEGIHFVRDNSRVVRYNLNLCLDWLANRGDPHAHQQAIEAYLVALSASKKKTRNSASKINQNSQ